MPGTIKSATFGDMLNEYLVYSNILEESFVDQNWLMKTSNKVRTWDGGTLVVPFQQSTASSIRMGGLTKEDDIDEATYMRGEISGYKEMYASLVFNSKDLFLDHYRVSVQNFLKILPDQIEQLMRYMKQSTSIQVLNGGFLDTVQSGTAGGATGEIFVAHPERFVIGGKFVLVDDDTAAASFYVTAIDKNTGIVIFSDTRGGSTVDMTAYDDTTKIYIPDGQGGGAFSSLRDMLLPADEGGSDTFAGKDKADSPFAQSVLYDAGGTTINSGDWNHGTIVGGNDILTLCFDALRKGHQRGAEPECFVMSYLNYSAALLAVEKNAGGFKNTKAAVDYAGYSSITVGGMHGSIELVGVREMADDAIFGVKKSHMDFHCGAKMFNILTSPDGLKYYTVRSETGYRYITDIVFNGDFLYSNPWSAVAIYNIPPISLPGITGAQ
jgi:hypothetical protein